MEIHQIGKGGSRPELRALTGLRGMAASVVALAHFSTTPLPYDIQRLFWSHAAVDLFFCLSGFTLSYVYVQQRFDFSSYLTARIARIFPLYFVTLIIVGAAYVWPMVVNPITYPAGTAIADLVRQALMLNSWPVIGSGVHWNFPAWSISVEWFCYVVLFPMLLFLRLPRSENFKLLCLVALSAISFALFQSYFDDRLSTADYVAKSHWNHWVNLLRGVLGFTAGWIVFTSFEERDDLYALCTRFSTPIWLGSVPILILQYCGSGSHALVFLFPFIVLAATNPASVTSRLLGSRVLHFLGVISYSIYLTHFIVFMAFVAKFGAPDTWSVSIYASLIGATLLTSICTYFAIERPARDAMRAQVRGRSLAGSAHALVEPLDAKKPPG